MYPSDLAAISQGDLRATQSARLVALIDRLRSVDVEFWRRKLADTPEIRSLDDIPSLPMTTKAEFRETYPAGMVAVPMDDVVRVHASSGTSGKPTIVAYTADDVRVFAEVNARSIALAGATGSSVVHVAYGYGLFTGGLGLHYGVEALGAAAVPASGGNPGFQVRLLADLAADGLACTPSYSLLLAERAADEGVLGDIQLRWGIHGAEPWSEGLRQKIEEAWGGGFTACDIYGLSEIIGPGVASEWSQHKGMMVIMEDHFYPEVIDPFTGEPLPDGELGELVLTTLTKQAQPVIRYRTGDITRLLPPVGGLPLRCIDRLQGRADDMLIIRGINVYPREIETVLLDDPDLGGQFAIIVDKRGTLDEVEARVELRDAALAPQRDAIAIRIQQRLMQTIRLRVKVDVRDPGEVPRQEIGKAKRVFMRTDEVHPLGD
ncbi:MAG: phenylacetate--CoA ligase [Acidimicrobiia bacterium]|nr:phenylacetate--CoA ligase [Acidimicrobiia bacterium]